MSRPELQLPPDLYYNETESRKYTSSSRIIQVQREIANRCIELISLPDDESAYVLDVGCGSGLSGQALEEAGHVWLGCDISPSMLEVAREEVTLSVSTMCLNPKGQEFIHTFRRMRIRPEI